MSNINADRIKSLQVIEDLRYGKGFKHQEERYVEKEKIKFLSDSERMKLYESNNYMDRVISEIVNLSPRLKSLKYTTKSDKKIKLIKESLEAIHWEDLDTDITDTQIFKADCFLEIYFVSGDAIPRLRKLDSKKMIDIARDNYGRVKAYIYKDRIVDESVDYYGITAKVDRDSEREVTWIFERGKTTILDPYNKLKNTNGEVILDDNGEEVISPLVIPHKDIFYDEFYIIHIPSIKQTDNAFSDIIASKYIDPSLRLDAIVSDYRYINRMNAMGLNVIIDGALGVGSSRSPGGFINLKSSSENNQAKFIRVEIQNKLDTLLEEKLDTEIDLYRKAFLIRPDMEKAIGSSDSSRNTQQLRLPLEKFLSKLIYHKNAGMKKYFEMVQKSVGYKTYDNFEFEIPNPIIENSVFDQLLQDMQELNMGRKTIRDLWRRDGLSEKEIAKKEKEINEEIINGTNDITISKQVQSVVNNGNNVINSDKLDNNFKSGGRNKNGKNVTKT